MSKFHRPILEMGLHGGPFQHANSSTLYKWPKYVRWVKNKMLNVNCFVDEAIPRGIDVDCPTKIAWMVEWPDIVAKGGINNPLDYVRDNHDQVSEAYKYVFTYHKELIGLHDNFIFTPPLGYWVREPGLYTKSRLVSMISSSKSMIPGHEHRLSWVNKLRDKVDLYGRGFNEIESKDDGLKDYMFSVAIENANWITEKVLDCFVTGTVPVYWGCTTISDHFNPAGIIMLDDNFDISQLSSDEYIKRKDAIKENFNIAMQYDIPEDIMYDNYLYKLL